MKEEKDQEEGSIFQVEGELRVQYMDIKYVKEVGVVGRFQILQEFVYYDFVLNKILKVFWKGLNGNGVIDLQ